MAVSRGVRSNNAVSQITLASGEVADIPLVVQADANGNIITGSGASASQVQGNIAAGVADAGNPVKIGGLASIGVPIARNNGERVDAWFDYRGAQVVALGSGGTAATFINIAGDATTNSISAFVSGSYSYGFNGTSWDRMRGDTNGIVVQAALSSTYWGYAAATGGIVSSVADVALKAAAGAGVRNYIKSLTIAHDVLSAVTECVVKDGATVIWRGKLQTAAVDSAAGSGTIIFDPPLRGTANTALNFALLTSVTGGVFVNAQGYTGS